MKHKKALLWQTSALETIQEFQINSGQNGYACLIAASVGAGKTWLALESAKRMLSNSLIDRIIIITFTGYLVEQWEKVAKREFNLNLLQVRTNGVLEDNFPDDAHGYVCTYQGMFSWPELHEAFAHGKRTIVIFDEIHHLGDNDEGDKKNKSKWGEIAKQTFHSVAFKLALSGTPFRCGATQRIPFLDYKSAQGSNSEFDVKPDYEYSYGRAVSERVCRRTVFRDVDGPISWDLKANDKAKTFEHRFEDKIPESLWSSRLRSSVWIEANQTTISTCKNKFLVEMLRKSNKKLQDIRNSGHNDAGGLIVAMDTTHARRLKSLLKSITGLDAIIVLNDEPGSAKAIRDFAKGTSPWIIAVKMVAEGVDINRLRICVYAAHVTEKLFILQVLGRIVRITNNWGESYFYYPADSRIVEIVKEVEEEMNLRLREKKPVDRKGGEQNPSVEWNFNKARADKWGAMASGSNYTDAEIDAADAVRARFESMKNVPTTDFIKAMREASDYQPNKDEESGENMSYTEQREDLRTTLQRRVGRLHHLTGQPHNDIHTALNRHAGVWNKNEASIQQLNIMSNHLEELIDMAENGDNDDE